MSKRADKIEGRKARILVIDDEETAVYVVTQILELAGYEVISSRSCKHGLFLQHETPADLIIVDIFMPDLNGLEAIHRLKKTDPRVPIVAISGGSTVAGRDCLELATEKGADHTFRKPFKAAEFVEVIDAALA
jgi:CheY-like chemotaxis protein